MKVIWKGSIAFGLVNIPINLYSAIEARGIKTKLLYKKNLSPIRYKRWCDDCKKEVPWEDIVKGFEIGEDEFVVMTQKELDAIKPEKSKAVDIVEFIEIQQIDPIYFNSHYYIGPEKSEEKAYFLFKEILEKTGKMAVGQFIMHEKMHTCAIESYREGLLLTTLNYGYEIRDISEIKELKKKPKLSKQELELAEKLIEKISVKKFDINIFKDTFHDHLVEMLKKKEKGQKITVEKKERPTKTKEENLISALKASLKK